MDIRIMSTRTHAMLDYPLALFLIWFSFQLETDDPMVRWTTLGFAVGLLLLALTTRYQYSLLKLVPISVYLAADSTVGLLLIGLPFFFRIEAVYYWVYLPVGTLLLLKGFMTRTGAKISRRQFEREPNLYGGK